MKKFLGAILVFGCLISLCGCEKGPIYDPTKFQEPLETYKYELTVEKYVQIAKNYLYDFGLAPSKADEVLISCFTEKVGTYESGIYTENVLFFARADDAFAQWFWVPSSEDLSEAHAIAHTEIGFFEDSQIAPPEFSEFGQKAVFDFNPLQNDSEQILYRDDDMVVSYTVYHELPDFLDSPIVQQIGDLPTVGLYRAYSFVWTVAAGQRQELLLLYDEIGLLFVRVSAESDLDFPYKDKDFPILPQARDCRQ